MDRRGFPGELQRAQCEPDRMAGKGRGNAAARGRGDRPGIAWRGTQCRAHVEFARGPEVPRAARRSLRVSAFRFIRLIALALAACAAACSFAGEKVLASRVWPALEYTRVTLESTRAIRHQFFMLSDPERMVVDLEGMELDAELTALPTNVSDSDPYIQAVRVGINRPNVVRVVFDLRTEVKPSVFPL